MLQLARKKDVYQSLEKFELCQEDFIESLKQQHRNKYDFVIACGLMNCNYMDFKLFEQMLIVLKNDGFIIFTARFSYMGTFWYQKHIDDLINLKRIEFVD
jgi:predicted TPR repeat methyltransferase